MSSPVTIQIRTAMWRTIPGLRDNLQKAARTTLAALPPMWQSTAERAHVTVRLTNNREVRVLNRTWRNKDAPTNVLSFPAMSVEKLRQHKNTGEIIEIGDIALAWQYILEETSLKGYVLAHHVTHLVIHGILHIFGYTHDSSRAEKRMTMLETLIMHKIGLPDPWSDGKANLN